MPHSCEPANVSVVSAQQDSIYYRLNLIGDIRVRPWYGYTRWRAKRTSNVKLVSLHGDRLFMPLPVAHGLIGASIVAVGCPRESCASRLRPLLMGAVTAICADLDYLLIWFLKLDESWHRSFTHSITFAFIFGLLAAAGAGVSNLKEVPAYVAAALSHPLLDVFTTRDSRGLELYWPISAQSVKYGLIDYPEIKLHLLQQPLADQMMRLLKLSLLEALICSPVLLTAILLKQGPGAWRRRQS